ncbi:hypothetical protein B0I26_1426 [Anoxybacillus vitaminiphilus]|jgi:hypothetical protein|uniref:Uncharacterized protein n=1 Tax=Paranoxybacillus vitaminiphilus TaxID=581036 RepID=A0A327Y0J7_9BACL|nr:hypothetical protein [Anoxybacillus vitaminiphilus]RAK13957.1 hypothetical protein B0I26_1426 [Anoxybacillus vitaminiphilus]
MSKIAGQSFNSSEELFSEIKKTLQVCNLCIRSKKDHPYHFILEIGTNEDEKVGRLKVHYNKFFRCTSVNIIDPIAATYYKLLTELLPIKKASVIQSDFFMDYLQNNYHFTVSIIHDSATFKCYELHLNNKKVWVKISKGTEAVCQYLMGDTDLFDEVQYIYEEGISSGATF